jgi:hypothetical protein
MPYMDKAIRQLGGEGNITSAAHNNIKSSIMKVITGGTGLVAPKYNSPTSSHSHNYGNKLGAEAFSTVPTGTARPALQMYKPSSMIGGNTVSPTITRHEVKKLTGGTPTKPQLEVVNNNLSSMFTTAKTTYAGAGGNVTSRSLTLAVNNHAK